MDIVLIQQNQHNQDWRQAPRVSGAKHWSSKKLVEMSPWFGDLMVH